MRLPKNVVRATTKASSSKKNQRRNNSSSRILPQEDILTEEITSIANTAKRKPRKVVNASDDWRDDYADHEEGLELTEVKKEGEEVDDEEEEIRFRREDHQPLLESESQNSTRSSNVKYSAADTIANFIRYGIVGVPG